MLGDEETCRACRCDEAFHEQIEGPVQTPLVQNVAGAGSSFRGSLPLSKTQGERACQEVEEGEGLQEGNLQLNQVGQSTHQGGGSGVQTVDDSKQDALEGFAGKDEMSKGEEGPAAKRAKVDCESAGKGVAKASAGVYDAPLESF